MKPHTENSNMMMNTTLNQLRSLRLESTPGTGSTFTFTLPIA